MPGTRDLLFEIGVEELPASFVQAALDALPAIAQKRLAEARLAHGPVRALGTPRRLALLVRDVADRQADLAEDLVGPPASAAYDKEGKPTRAAEAFAKRLGVAVEDLRAVKTPKGKYLAGTRREAGKPAAELVGPVLERAAAEIPFKKSMRWADLDVAFGRPVQWIVALLGDDVVDVSIAGVRSGRESRGHRFLCPGPVPLPGAGAYVEALRAAHVIADPDERGRAMRERLEAAAREAGGAIVEDEYLFVENLHLVEEPFVLAGGFDERFLDLPEAVVTQVARGHQRYFCVRGPDGRLLPRYLLVANTATRPDEVRRGNDRVMRARLADARFFYEEDVRAPLAARRDKLAGIVFQNRLGHMLAKTERVEALVPALGAEIGLPETTVRTAVEGARLAKCDLVTLMVGEFPELQGAVGRDYAVAQGVAAEVADVVRDHYAPRGASDATAPADPSALVALADRLDTLVGCFAIGLQPTGAADPFALRRAAIGVLRTVIDRGWPLALSRAVELGHGGLRLPETKGPRLDLGEVAARLGDFFRERLRGILEADFPQDVVAACIAPGSDRPTDARARARSLAGLAPEVRARAGEVFRRAANIAKDAPDGAPRAPSEVVPDVHASEGALWAAFVRLGADLDATSAKGDYDAAFAAMAAFAPVLHTFFEDVFVMVEERDVRENRLRLMRAIAERASAVAHFQLLAPPPGAERA